MDQSSLVHVMCTYVMAHMHKQVMARVLRNAAGSMSCVHTSWHMIYINKSWNVYGGKQRDTRRVCVNKSTVVNMCTT